MIHTVAEHSTQFISSGGDNVELEISFPTLRIPPARHLMTFPAPAPLDLRRHRSDLLLLRFNTGIALNG